MTLERLAAACETDDLRGALARVLERYESRVALASSLSVEDMVVLHELVEAARGSGRSVPRVFFLDTGRMHEETYLLLDRARERYDVSIEVFAPQAEAVQSLVRAHGAYGMRHSREQRQACCSVRKLEPLGRALRELDAWITGLRSEQSVTRAGVSVVEVDDAHGGIAKINPLARWTSERVWEHARRHGVPTHALHAQGYPSIGCEPCTRAVEAGEHPRAGRWWWEDEGHRECGLHGTRGAG